MVKSVCVKAVPDSTKLRLVKVKNFQGNMPPDPHSLPHALHTDTYLPPKNPYNIILPTPLPPDKKLKAERNPADCITAHNTTSHDCHSFTWESDDLRCHTLMLCPLTESGDC